MDGSLAMTKNNFPPGFASLAIEASVFGMSATGMCSNTSVQRTRSKWFCAAFVWWIGPISIAPVSNKSAQKFSTTQLLNSIP